MFEGQTSSLVSVLQTAIGPVVVISGVGLLLLTMTNRLGRVIDRTRTLAALRADPAADARQLEPVRAQLRILGYRARIIRRAIALAAFCVLFAAILVIALFLAALFDADVPWLIAALFILSMACLIGSMIEFIRDINKALWAAKLEAGPDWDDDQS